MIEYAGHLGSEQDHQEGGIGEVSGHLTGRGVRFKQKSLVTSKCSQMIHATERNRERMVEVVKNMDNL